MSKGIEPMMTCKAYNGRVVCAWLASCAQRLLQQHPDVLEYQLMSTCMPPPKTGTAHMYCASLLMLFCSCVLSAQEALPKHAFLASGLVATTSCLKSRKLDVFCDGPSISIIHMPLNEKLQKLLT